MMDAQLLLERLQREADEQETARRRKRADGGARDDGSTDAIPFLAGVLTDDFREAVFDFERGLAVLSELTAADVEVWEAEELERRFPDCYSVPRDTVIALSPERRAALVARAIQELAHAYQWQRWMLRHLAGIVDEAEDMFDQYLTNQSWRLRKDELRADYWAHQSGAEAEAEAARWAEIVAVSTANFKAEEAGYAETYGKPWRGAGRQDLASFYEMVAADKARTQDAEAAPKARACAPRATKNEATS